MAATGKKLPTDRSSAPKVAKNETVKSATASTSASKAEHGKQFLWNSEYLKSNFKLCHR